MAQRSTDSMDSTEQLLAVAKVRHAQFFTESSWLQLGLEKESDRGLALMTASVLDDRMRTLLSRAFVDEEVANGLLGKEGQGSTRPLSAFSVRIDIAYSLGIIGKPLRDQLHLVRAVRNKFAHSARPLTFEDEPVRGLVACMRSVIVEDLIAKGYRAGPRDRFYLAASTLHHAVYHIGSELTCHDAWPSNLDLSIMSEEESAKAIDWVKAVQAGRSPRPRVWPSMCQ